MNSIRNWRLLSAKARAAIPKVYFAEEQADILALLDTLDRGMEMLEAGEMSDEQLADMLAILHTALRKPSSN